MNKNFQATISLTIIEDATCLRGGRAVTWDRVFRLLVLSAKTHS
jgi:hypothetical protein